MPKSKSTNSMSTRAISSVALSAAPIWKSSGCLRWSSTWRDDIEDDEDDDDDDDEDEVEE